MVLWFCTPVISQSGALSTLHLVRLVGLEPTLPYGKQILSLSRLPIPPQPHMYLDGHDDGMVCNLGVHIILALDPADLVVFIFQKTSLV